MSTRLSSIIIALSMALGTAPAIAQQQQQGLSELAANDFRCFALMGAQRDLLLNRTDVDAEQKAGRLIELNVLTAFYNGRSSQYNANQVSSALQGTTRQLLAMEQAALDAEMQRCTNFYLNVRQSMTEARAQAAQAISGQQQQ
ncbi:hypothetical protein [Alterisphingorhabdus coralli]|uniref:Uncharacterized protein n=1 Tax=Alterisphingorhabdus coralli TaxID=3071408 RepID=A0AA97FB70_9SPHN|nr:hypothetical protein [Parasphingorhabdus sp. SCSIO 66989]WOE76422.1 hypothetical protein RB602_06835 [Parasphingorhabdus sp. SCSIO 66989]